MSGARIVAGRFDYDALAAGAVDKAFDTRYNTLKIGRCMSGTTGTPVAHGLPYAPKVKSFIEFEPGKFSCIDANVSVDATYINGTDDTWTYVFIDQLTSGSYKKKMRGRQVVLVGDGTIGDHNYRLHSGYDTFKVYKTGTLTINASEYDPGSSGGTDVETATFTHGLGYPPAFAPFLTNGFTVEFYASSQSSFYEVYSWSTGRTFYTGQYFYNSPATDYRCIKTHVSEASNEPGVGANWEEYWEAFDANAYYGDMYTNVYVNDMEDFKGAFTFGYEGQNYAEVRYYVTNNELVLELTRVCTAEDPPLVVYEPYPAMTVTVDYTIFYNKINEELNLLTG